MKQANTMGNFAEVLTNNQAKNINKSLTTYNKAKSSTGAATIRLTQTKQKLRGGYN